MTMSGGVYNNLNHRPSARQLLTPSCTRPTPSNNHSGGSMTATPMTPVLSDSAHSAYGSNYARNSSILRFQSLSHSKILDVMQKKSVNSSGSRGADGPANGPLAAARGLPGSSITIDQANSDLDEIIDETDANLRSIIVTKQRKLEDSKRSVQGQQKLPFI